MRAGTASRVFATAAPRSTKGSNEDLEAMMKELGVTREELESEMAAAARSFGHVQWSPEERAAASVGKVVFLQIGEGDFNDEGVFSVLIDEGALARRDFGAVTGYWAQT